MKQQPISEVYNLDCMEFMQRFPDSHFDLAIVDPPYFSGPERRSYYGSKNSPHRIKHKEYGVSEKWDIPTENYFKELLRVCKHYIIWGCNYFHFQFASGRIVWDKCNAQSSFSDCEIAATDLIGSVRLFPFMWNGMQQGLSINNGRSMQPNKALNEKRIHPTQKPVALYVWTLQKFAKKDWSILDTHLGSGSSRIAAYSLGYDFFGTEIDKKYFDLAQERFSRECLGTEVIGEQKIQQLTLFK